MFSDSLWKETGECEAEGEEEREEIAKATGIATVAATAVVFVVTTDLKNAIFFLYVPRCEFFIARGQSLVRSRIWTIHIFRFELCIF